MDEINKRMQTKIRYVEMILDLAKRRDLVDRLTEVTIRYEMLYSKIVMQCADGDSRTTSKEKRDISAKRIADGDIIDCLNDIVLSVKTGLISDEQEEMRHAMPRVAQMNRKINELIYEYDMVDIPMEMGAPVEQRCAECDYLLDISPDKTTYVCYGCGDVTDIKDNIVEAPKQAPKSKTGNFKPNRHFKKWIDHILAREPEESLGDPNDRENARGEKMLDDIKTLCVKKGYNAEYITIEDMRTILKELNKTEYNDNISLIMKKLTGRGPPSLSDESYSLVCTRFLQIMEIRDNIKKDGRTNRIYYPYYIYKIFDITLEGDERRAMEYIHLHSIPTLTANDEEWRKICMSHKLPFLDGKYKPTRHGRK